MRLWCDVMEEKEISQAVIGRLPRYYRYLRDLKEQGKQRISSQELSDIMKVTASQIRQDLNTFGGFGQQGYGYNIEYLYEEIGKILDMDKVHNMVLIGAGNLGQALMNYASFTITGFCFTRAFDVSKKLQGTTIAGVQVDPASEMEAYLCSNPVDIAVIAIPRGEAQEVAAKLVACGITAIWNFAPVDIDVPEHVTVENVHLQDSLMKLSYLASKHES